MSLTGTKIKDRVGKTIVRWVVSMRKSLIISALIAGSLSVYAQGTVNFNDNTSDFQIHIHVGGLNPEVEEYGNASNDRPPGTTVYTGQLLGGSTAGTGPFFYSDGADYTVQLYAAPGLNDAVSALLPVSQYKSTLYTIAAGAGMFIPVTFSANISDPGIPNTANGQATLAIACWYNPGGNTYATEADAVEAMVPAGMSLPANLTDLGNIGGPPSTPPDLVGIQSFSIVAPQIIPEPGPIALAAIGASAFLFRRRKGCRKIVSNQS